MIEFSEGAATLRPNCPTGWIYTDAFHPTEIKDEAIIASAKTGHRVPAAAYRQVETLFPCEVHRGDHIGNIRRLNNQCWPAIMQGIIYSACLVITVIGRMNQRTAKRALKVFKIASVDMVQGHILCLLRLLLANQVCVVGV
jgi:hypothetical protein